MNEIITVGGVEYTATKVSTGINTISFMLQDLTEDEAKSVFEAVQSLSVGDDGGVYGEYPDVEFESVTIGADDSVTVSMHILSKTEKQIRDLQKAVTGHDTAMAEHDVAIAGLMFGGDVNE